MPQNVAIRNNWSQLHSPEMQMAFFSVPARGDAGLQEDLNVFLRSHRVLTMHREFVGRRTS